MMIFALSSNAFPVSLVAFKPGGAPADESLYASRPLGLGLTGGFFFPERRVTYPIIFSHFTLLSMFSP